MGSSGQPQEEGNLQARKLRLKEREWLEQDHTPGSKRSQDLNPDREDCKALTTRFTGQWWGGTKLPASAVFQSAFIHRHLLNTPLCQVLGLVLGTLR